MVYVRAQTGPPNVGDPRRQFTVQYFDHQGNLLIRSGGTRAWRCNNPGNLQKSPYSISQRAGAIGFAGDELNEYAVYPDRDTGWSALIKMLKGSIYSPMTIRKALEKYEYHKKDYADIVAERTRLDTNRTIKSLNDREFKRLCNIFSVNLGGMRREEIFCFVRSA